MQLTRKHLIELGLTTDDKVIYDDHPIRVQVTDTTADDGRPPEVFTWWAAGRIIDPSPQTLEEACSLLNKTHPAMGLPETTFNQTVGPEGSKQIADAINGSKQNATNELDPGLSLDGGGEGS